MHDIHNHQFIDMSFFHRIDINLYPLFISIYEQHSISKAAQIMNITQSAASHALQRLRQHLNDDLFVRTGSQMLPTPFAEQIYPAIKDALIAIQRISLPSQSFDPNTVKTLKIAVHDEIEPIVFPQLVKHFLHSAYAIQFVSIKLDRKNMVADMATQQIDFVIDLEQNVSDKIQFKKLVQDEFVICTQQTRMDKHLYFSSPHIGVSSRRTGVLVEDVYFNKLKLHRQIMMRCQHYSTALQILALHPEAVLTIPKNILSHLEIPKGLQVFEVPVDLPKIGMGMYWHVDLKENKRHAFLRSELIKIYT